MRLPKTLVVAACTAALSAALVTGVSAATENAGPAKESYYACLNAGALS
jgi:hypothetical protein